MNKLLRLQCQLPSLSLPNWLTLLSSAPPEITGLIANEIVDSAFDNFFKVYKLNNTNNKVLLSMIYICLFIHLYHIGGSAL